MRLVIDMQGAQSASRFRGIGRYSTALAQAILRNNRDHDIYLVLNGLFPETLDPIREAFSDLLPAEKIRVWRAPGPACFEDPANAWRRKTAEILREAFIASLQPDVLLITSLFEGYSDNAVLSIGKHGPQPRTSVVLYDLIPYIYPGEYLAIPPLKKHYLSTIDTLKRADLLLGISESSSREARVHLDFPEDRIVTISSAADGQFQPPQLSGEALRDLRDRYGLFREIVLYAPGGFDFRKNFDTLIAAYARLPRALRETHQLVIVSKIGNPAIADHLQRLARQAGLSQEEFILTGYVPDGDLIGLYSLAALCVFPSRHEGFGLPVLEAMCCGAAVIGSNVTSIPEVIGNPEALFDPEDPQAITRMMRKGLTDPDFRQSLRDHASRQIHRFSWDETGLKALRALEALHRQEKKTPRPRKTTKPRMALVSPLPPERSGIATYTATLIPELSAYYDLEIVVAQETVRHPVLADAPPLRSPEWLRAHAPSMDRILYHFGNSHFHTHMPGLLHETSGVVVLHDFFLSGLKGCMAEKGLSPSGFLQSVYEAHGYAALAAVTPWDEGRAREKYPVNLDVLQNSRGVIVHSHYAMELAERWYGPQAAADMRHVPLLREIPPPRDRESCRRRLGFHPEDFVICSFGLTDPTKMSRILLDAWRASSLARDPHCHLVFAGENNPGPYGTEILKIIQKSMESGRIRITGWLEDTDFEDYLQAADMGVQLRTLSRGETSAAVLDCMGHGLPTLVNANGTMAELPADAVYMLPDAFTPESLIQALETLRQDSQLRKTLGEKACAHVRLHHAPSACAARYHEIIESFYAERRVALPSLIQAIARNGASTPSEEDLRKTAAAIADSFPPRPRQKQLLLEVSATDAPPPDQARRILQRIQEPPEGRRTEPVYQENGQYRYARRHTLRILGYPEHLLSDEPAEILPEDRLADPHLEAPSPAGPEK